MPKISLLCPRMQQKFSQMIRNQQYRTVKALYNDNDVLGIENLDISK